MENTLVFRMGYLFRKPAKCRCGKRLTFYDHFSNCDYQKIQDEINFLTQNKINFGNNSNKIIEYPMAGEYIINNSASDVLLLNDKIIKKLLDAQKTENEQMKRD